MAIETPNYDINYDDKRLTDIKEEGQNAVNDVANTYDEMINSSNKYYQDLKDETHAWGEEQKKLQQEQTDFTIKKIEQQKEQAEKDYLKEQSGAFVDYQKQTNQYGGSAEQMAAQGLSRSGYAETTRAGYYNAYQNRVATTKAAYVQAETNYNNSIKEAMLQNSAALAQLAHDTFIQELEYSLEGFQHENQLINEKIKQKLDLETQYYSRWRDELAQINSENALKEEARQFNLDLGQQQDEFALKKDEFESSTSSSEEDVGLTDEGAETVTLLDNTGDTGSNEDQKVEISIDSDNVDYEVSTPYYQGKRNEDAKLFGTFENGYQPKGIAGYGKVKKTGDTYTFTTEYKYGNKAGQKLTVTQNIWYTVKDGKVQTWYWDGTQNQYLPMPEISE